MAHSHQQLPTFALIVGFFSAAFVSLSGQQAIACPKCRLGAKALVGNTCDLSLTEKTADPSKDAELDLPDDPSSVSDAPVHESKVDSALTLSGGIDVVSAYYYRGIRQEDEGLIAQPNFTLGLIVYRKRDVAITPYVATFDSFHSEHTHAENDSPDAWYESEIYAGVLIEVGPLALDVKYSIHVYPNGGLDQIQEVAAKLSYDFASLWRPVGAPADFVLTGWVLVARETQDANVFPAAVPAGGGGTDGRGGHPVFISGNRAPGHYLPPPPIIGQKRGFDPTGEDTYVEVGLEPSMRVKAGDTTFGLAFPVILGMSADSYYGNSGGHNDPIGYVSVAAKVTIPIGVPDRFGRWYFNASVTWLHLFSDTIIAANQGDRDEGIAGVGLSVGF